MTSESLSDHAIPAAAELAAPPPATAVTVLGLGSLGSALATALVAAGHPVTVWNRTTSRADRLVSAGAVQAPSVGAAVEASPVVVVCVSTYEDVTAVVRPVADALAGRTVVNVSSGTPEQARAMAAQLGMHGAAYLDGAAMSGTRLVGQPEALFLYAGSAETFEGVRVLLAALGRAVHVGEDPGMASLHDTALLTVNLGLLAGFYHGAAMVRAGGVDPVSFAAVTTDYLPFAVGLIGDHARQAEQGRYPDADGALAVYAAAVEHVVATSRQLELTTDLPDGLRVLIDRAVTSGHGSDGLARLIDVIAQRPR